MGKRQLNHGPDGGSRAGEGRCAGQAAIVTGAARGIGQAIAHALAAEGIGLVLADVDARPGRVTARELQDRGAAAHFVRADVAREVDVRRLAATALRALGRIDVLVNNAGILRVGPIHRMRPVTWDRVLAVNLRGPFLCTRALLPVMIRQRRGCIVNIASALGKGGIGEFGAYCASKFGLIGFTEAVADEVRGQGVRVNAVCPGVVDTRMGRPFGGAAGLRPEAVAALVREIVCGKFADATGRAFDIP